MCIPVHVGHISSDQYNQQQTTQSILVRLYIISIHFVLCRSRWTAKQFYVQCRYMYIEFMNVN